MTGQCTWACGRGQGDLLNFRLPFKLLGIGAAFDAVQINHFYSSCTRASHGAPQGSVLELLLFHFLPPS